MKTDMQSGTGPFMSCRDSGFALVIVLGLLVLITIVVITFFSQVRNGTAETAAYAQQSSAEEVGGLATQIVEAQIRAATTGGRTIAWASQPGMIRTWDSTGAAATNYRLYSWNALTTTGTFTSADYTAMLNWKSASATSSFNAMWCDLNSPKASPNPAAYTGTSTVLDYPITTPPLTDGSTGLSLDPTNGIAANNPVADPSNTIAPGIQGYSISSPPGFVSGSAPSPTNNPAPMPVQWLYVLPPAPRRRSPFLEPPRPIRSQGVSPSGPMMKPAK
jgi:hypothetical protein